MYKNIPRILLTACASGVGKTMITCGILQALKNRQVSVAAFKCGPDYIDPMFHRKVIGIPSYNLDTFLCGRTGVKEILFRHGNGVSKMEELNPCISVIEGVMGYYDGLAGISTDASAYDVADTTQTPAVLIVDCKGISLSIVPFIQGFLRYKEKDGDTSHIQGVILNRISPMMYERIKGVLEQETQIKVLGYVPVLRDFTLESRHLGLKMPEEIENLQQKLFKLAEILEKTLDLDGLIELSRSAVGIECMESHIRLQGEKQKNSMDLRGKADVQKETLRLAVARDEAFCFFYEENLEILRESGAELVYFSPIHDTQLPKQISGILLPGGYPELYLKQLEQNHSMRTSIRNALEAKMPCMAECGGFQYLQERMSDETGAEFSMVGALPGMSYHTASLRRFGYVMLEGGEVFGKDIGKIPAHEFHYYDSEDCGQAFDAKKPLSNRQWKCMISTSQLLAGYPHIHYRGNPGIVEAFLETCKSWRKHATEI